MKLIIFAVFLLLLFDKALADNTIEENFGTVEQNFGASKEALRTDDQTIQYGEQKKVEVYNFQTEVNRMMKLIINSLYRNKEIFLRELISNASDALDKIRLLALTDSDVLSSNPETFIRIKADKEKKILSITDTGIGMTRQDLLNNLGTIAKSGTAEFLSKMQESNAKDKMNDMIGQFGVGFYSVFLVADEVVVTTKHNDDKQYIWKSDSVNFSITEDPEGNTLKRGTTVSLHMKDEAADFLEPDTIKNLIKKYSQFINFSIYLWNSKTIEVEEEDQQDSITTTTTEESEKSKNEKDNDTVEEDKVETSDEEEEEDAKIEEAKEEGAEKNKKKVKKTVWDWELLNSSKPIWTKKPSDITDEEYTNFYKVLTKDTQDPLTKVHFNAEGEVTFKSLLFIPRVQPSDSFNRYGTKTDNIKLYVRRVFISDKFNELIPNYLAFIQGIVDSDDLPLNVSRENLQQHKLIKIIKKKLIRKILDTIKKLEQEDYLAFWKEYSTNIKLGIIEDAQNRARLAKLLMFHTSAQSNLTSLADYVSRAKDSQKHIYYIAGSSLQEVKKSPFTEKLLKNGYEVLYLTEAIDEYALSSIPEFDGKKFQNVAKEGFSMDEGAKSSEEKEQLAKAYEPLTKYLNDLLKEYVNKVQLSDRLTNSPCALVASMFGWTGNMERLAISNAHQKSDDPQKSYYLNQKKTLEINAHHPLVKELLRRAEIDKEDEFLKDMALMMFHTATLRSGYMLRESATFANNVEKLMRKVMGITHSDDQLSDDEGDRRDEAVDTELDPLDTDETDKTTDHHYNDEL